MAKKIILIDGHSILSRAFYGIPMLTTQEGLHTNAVYGFLNIILKILDEEQAEYLAVAFDIKAPTFRHKMYEAYKGTRKPMPPELHEQVPVMKQVLDAMHIPHIELEGYEADDILGTAAARCEALGMEVSLVSGDRDMLQLATAHTKIRIPKTSRGRTEIHDYYADDVLAEYGVTPMEFIEVKALMGDASDNIPGVPSIGEKTATSIICAYHSIENAYAHLDELRPPKAQKALREHYELAQLSKTLAAINTNAPISFTPEQARIGSLFTTEAYTLFKRLEFKSLLSRFEAQESGAALWTPQIRIQEETEPQSVCAAVAAYLAQPAAGFSCLAEEGQLYGIALASASDPLLYIPFPVSEGGQAKLLPLITGLLDEAAQTTIYVQDIKTLWHFFPVSRRSHFVDVSIAAYLLNPLKNSYPYEELAHEYAHITMPSREELLGKRRLNEALMTMTEELARYACLQSAGALHSGPALLAALDAAGMRSLYDTIELPTAFALAAMEKEGIRVRRELLERFNERLTDSIAAVENEIYALTGEPFNINSPKQLGAILFEKLQLPHGKKTKSGYSTSADILEKLTADYPVVQKILDYRQLTKLKSTYAEGLQAYISPDSRIHGTFNQTITATGRISSTEPNLQNIPTRTELGRELRKVFVAADGCVLVDADFSQIELRILAHMSEDKNLIRAYHTAQDIHALTASWVFGVPLDAVTPELRRNAKAVNFGIVYGISAFGLSEDLSISKQEAAEYIEKYFSVYPDVKRYLERLVTETKESGYAYTMFGRRRPVPEINASNFMQRQFGERIAMNSPIQGSAADIMKLAVIRVEEALRANHLRAHIVLQVHDEIIVEAPSAEEAAVKALLKEQMQNAAALSVPLEVDVHSGASWYDAK